MFTGIIETLGKVTTIQNKGANRIFYIKSDVTSELKISDSLAINGCCLTVIKKEKEIFAVEAISETYRNTNLAYLQIGDSVNLERARKINERLDGHLVQGHIDEVAKITNLKKSADWVVMEIGVSKSGRVYLIPKGSVAVDGISLTIAQRKNQRLAVNIIPYTYEHTNLKYKRVGDWVNIEFDVIGKYVIKFYCQRHSV